MTPASRGVGEVPLFCVSPADRRFRDLPRGTCAAAGVLVKPIGKRQRFDAQRVVRHRAIPARSVGLGVDLDTALGERGAESLEAGDPAQGSFATCWHDATAWIAKGGEPVLAALDREAEFVDEAVVTAT